MLITRHHTVFSLMKNKDGNLHKFLPMIRFSFEREVEMMKERIAMLTTINK